MSRGRSTPSPATPAPTSRGRPTSSSRRSSGDGPAAGDGLRHGRPPRRRLLLTRQWAPMGSSRSGTAHRRTPSGSSGKVTAVELDEVADELYAVPPEDFIALRTARQDEAKDDGDKALAKQIGALPKPSAAAWAANLLVRNQRAEIEGLVELGGLLREAQETLAGDELKALNRQRAQLLVGADPAGVRPRPRARPADQQLRRRAGRGDAAGRDDRARGGGGAAVGPAHLADVLHRHGHRDRPPRPPAGAPTEARAVGAARRSPRSRGARVRRTPPGARGGGAAGGGGDGAGRSWTRPGRPSTRRRRWPPRRPPRRRRTGGPPRRSTPAGRTCRRASRSCRASWPGRARRRAGGCRVHAGRAASARPPSARRPTPPRPGTGPWPTWPT